MARDLPLGYQPNLLVINCDDAPLNWDSGMPLFLANWASRFIAFPNASCNMPLCLPGRAATLTGQVVTHHHGTDNNEGANLRLDETFLVGAKRAGYYTAAIGKWINGFGEEGNGGFGDPERQPGLDYQRIMWGPPDYFGYEILREDSATPVAYGESAANGGSDANYATDVELTHVLEAIANAKALGKPFCIYWAPKAPHKDGGGAGGPTPAPRHASTPISLVQSKSFGLLPSAFENQPWLDEAGTSPWNAGAIADITAEHVDAMRTILALDEAIDGVLSQLQSDGSLDSTVVVRKTDNAHAYGELRLTDKGTPHPSASSPLMSVAVPGITGFVSQAAVSDIDVAPFVAELGGFALPVTPDGYSFYRACTDKAWLHREAALLHNPFKDSPLFIGAATPQGVFAYEGLPGGDAEGQAGSWDVEPAIVDQGPCPDLIDAMKRIVANLYPSEMP